METNTLWMCVITGILASLITFLLTKMESVATNTSIFVIFLLIFFVTVITAVPIHWLWVKYVE